jgi:hypothetical protein
MMPNGHSVQAGWKVSFTLFFLPFRCYYCSPNVFSTLLLARALPLYALRSTLMLPQGSSTEEVALF